MKELISTVKVTGGGGLHDHYSTLLLCLFLLCDSSLIVPQNTWDTKPDMRAILFFKCYSLQPTENSIYLEMTL